MSKHDCPERLSSRSKNYVEDGSGQQTMEVLVETLTGTAFEITVSPTETVFAIKSKIFRVEGIPVSQQHLIYGHRELEDSRTLRSLRIGSGARLRLVLSMRGGPISTRRWPPPSHQSTEKHWRDIEKLLEANRFDLREETTTWATAAEAGPGCKVTVLVFRDGDQVNMLRVLDHQDGSYSPLASTTYSSVEEIDDDCGLSGSVQENAVTMGKMMDLRRRMQALSLSRTHDDKPEVIHKTRSEETLVMPSMMDDHNYLFHRHTLLPPIGSRGEAVSSPLELTHPITSPHHYGSMLPRPSSRWLVRPFGGSHRQLFPPSPPLSPHPTPPLHPLPTPLAPLSASTLHLPDTRPTVTTSNFSSSTSDLENLKRNRILPALSRHRNREHLHLSDDGINLSGPEREVGFERREKREEVREGTGDGLEVAEAASGKKSRVRCGWCRRRLSVGARHTCRCGRTYCAPHRYAEVHGCGHDYKRARDHQPPLTAPLTAPKLPKI